MDRFGIGRVWGGGAICFIAGALLFMTVTAVGPTIIVARMLFVLGLAIMFIGSNAHIQLEVPAHRRTEAIGSLGSSGFVGMIAGAQLEGFLRVRIPDPSFYFRVLFGLAAVAGFLYLGLVWLLSRHDKYQPPEATPLAAFAPGPALARPGLPRGDPDGDGLCGHDRVPDAVRPVARPRERFQAVLHELRDRGVLGPHHQPDLEPVAGAEPDDPDRPVGTGGRVPALVPVSQSWHSFPAGLATGFAHALLFLRRLPGLREFPEHYRGPGRR